MKAVILLALFALCRAEYPAAVPEVVAPSDSYGPPAEAPVDAYAPPPQATADSYGAPATSLAADTFSAPAPVTVAAPAPLAVAAPAPLAPSDSYGAPVSPVTTFTSPIVIAPLDSYSAPAPALTNTFAAAPHTPADTYSAPAPAPAPAPQAPSDSYGPPAVKVAPIPTQTIQAAAAPEITIQAAPAPAPASAPATSAAFNFLSDLTTTAVTKNAVAQELQLVPGLIPPITNIPILPPALFPPTQFPVPVPVQPVPVQPVPVQPVPVQPVPVQPVPVQPFPVQPLSIATKAAPAPHITQVTAQIHQISAPQTATFLPHVYSDPTPLNYAPFYSFSSFPATTTSFLAQEALPHIETAAPALPQLTFKAEPVTTKITQPIKPLSTRYGPPAFEAKKKKK